MGWPLSRHRCPLIRYLVAVRQVGPKEVDQEGQRVARQVDLGEGLEVGLTKQGGLQGDQFLFPITNVKMNSLTSPPRGGSPLGYSPLLSPPWLGGLPRLWPRLSYLRSSSFL